MTHSNSGFSVVGEPPPLPQKIGLSPMPLLPQPLPTHCFPLKMLIF